MEAIQIFGFGVLALVVFGALKAMSDAKAREERLREALRPPAPRPGSADAREASTEEQRDGGMLGERVADTEEQRQPAPPRRSLWK